MLYEFCASHGVPHRKCGKLIVATDDAELDKIQAIEKQGDINGVEGLELIGGNAARAMEPELSCLGALHSPETGIIDSHALHAGAARRSRGRRRRDRLQHARSSGARAQGGQWQVTFGGARRRTFAFDAVVNCAGLGAQGVARAMEDYPAARVPRLVLGKGNYFAYAGKPVFSRLIYPTPIVGGLGVHVTLDLAGRMRFGPDVEWIDRGELRRRSGARAVVLRPHPHLLAGPAGRLAGAGLCRHPAEADRAGRAAGAIS